VEVNEVEEVEEVKEVNDKEGGVENGKWEIRKWGRERFYLRGSRGAAEGTESLGVEGEEGDSPQDTESREVGEEGKEGRRTPRAHVQLRPVGHPPERQLGMTWAVGATDR
jgi:hypothetical protein